MLLPHLAAACKAAREESGASIRALAREIDVSVSALSRFEAGRMVTWPSRVEVYVEAYAAAGGRRASEIWAQAIAGMESEGQPGQG